MSITQTSTEDLQFKLAGLEEIEDCGTEAFDLIILQIEEIEEELERREYDESDPGFCSVCSNRSGNCPECG